MNNKTETPKYVIPVLTRPPLSSQEEEEQEIAELDKEAPHIKYRETPKYLRWVELFMDKGNKYKLKTFGNQTLSAIHAYNLDPEKQYFTAAQVGTRNVKKVKNLASAYWSKQGVTHGKMYDIIFNKMVQSATPDLWFMIAQVIGMEIPKYTPVSNPATYIYNKKNEVHVEGGDEALGKLTDDQLDFLIESKSREVGTIAPIGGETAKNEAVPAQVLDSTRETIRGNE